MSRDARIRLAQMLLKDMPNSRINNTVEEIEELLGVEIEDLGGQQADADHTFYGKGVYQIRIPVRRVIR